MVALKIVLAEDLPKVSYMTYLDTYVIGCFFTIVLIIAENSLVAFLLGIDASNPKIINETEPAKMWI